MTIPRSRNKIRPSRSSSQSFGSMDDVVAHAFGDSMVSSAGVNVTTATATTLSTVWRAVNLIGDGVARAPCHVLRKNKTGDWERANEHPAYKLLRLAPNQQMTPSTLKKTLIGHALLSGNGYAYIFRDGAGRPKELIPLLPDRTHSVYMDGVRWFVTTIGNENRWIAPDDMLHLLGFSQDGLTGINWIEKARESVGWQLAMKNYGSKFFKNGARTTGTLTLPGHLSEQALERLRKSFTERHVGLSNAHKPIILEDGAEYKPMTLSQNDAQFLESMTFGILDVANWFGVAPHKLGHPGRNSFASIEAENQSHLDEALDPRLVSFEEEATLKLLSEDEISEGYRCEFNRNALVRVDYKTKILGRAKMIQSGELSPDEARKQEGLPPRDDGLGGKFVLPKNMQFADEREETAPAPTEPSEPIDDDGTGTGRATMTPAVRSVLDDAEARVRGRIANGARRAASDPKKYDAWLRDDASLIAAVEAIAGPASGLSTAPLKITQYVRAVLADLAALDGDDRPAAVSKYFATNPKLLFQGAE